MRKLPKKHNIRIRNIGIPVILFSAALVSFNSPAAIAVDYAIPPSNPTPATPTMPNMPPMMPSAPTAPTTTPDTTAQSAPSDIFTLDLKQGSNGDDVSMLQSRLTDEGIHSGPVTGFFGPLTLRAVMEYQRLNNLPVTGFVGPLTRTKLNSGMTSSAMMPETMGRAERIRQLQLQIDLMRQRLNELLQQLPTATRRGQPQQTSQTSQQQQGSMTTPEIIFADSGFSLSPLTVKIGTTVTFKNRSSTGVWPASAVHPTHDVYPVKGGCISSAFDACRTLQPGEEWSFKFDEKGEWRYHDHTNATRFGTVIVE